MPVSTAWCSDAVAGPGFLSRGTVGEGWRGDGSAVRLPREPGRRRHADNRTALDQDLGDDRRARAFHHERQRLRTSTCRADQGSISKKDHLDATIVHFGMRRPV